MSSSSRTKATSDSSNPSHPATAENAPPPRRLRHAILLILGLAVLLWAGRLLHHAFLYEKSDDAYLTAHLHFVSPEVGGKVAEVLVNENQRVRRGDILARLDPLEFELARDKAQAAVAQSEAQLIQANAVIPYAQAQVAAAIAHADQASAEVRRSGAQLALAASNLARNKQLFDRANGAVTQADVDTAQANFDSSQAADTAARSNLAAMEASVTSAKVLLSAGPSQAQASQAGIDAARSALRDAERQLGLTIIRAPSDGRIGNKNVETGNRVQIGQAIFAVVEDDSWVVANFKETQLARMRVGQPVKIAVDAIPGQVFNGKVDSFSPGTGSLFTLLPPDNATGNFTKVVQRVPVKILLDAGETRNLQARLHPGLSVLVSVQIR